MAGHIIQSTANGQEIGVIIAKLEEALTGTQRGHAIISCLSLVLAIMDPEIKPQDLTVGVKDISQFICMWLDGRDADPSEKAMMN